MTKSGHAEGYETLEVLINGRWRPGSSRHSEPVMNPATGEVLGHVPHVTGDDLDEALDASAQGFRAWGARSALDRQSVLQAAAALMTERRDAIAKVLTLEMGKPLAEAGGEVDFAIATTRWYGEEGRRAYGRLIPSRTPNTRHSVLKEPVGPAVAFVAWNFPATNVIRKVAGALAAGCSIIIKPSEETPGTCVAIARCFQDAGLPDGALNVVCGVPDTISRHLLASPIPKKVSFTGGVAVGKHLTRLAADTMKRCTMELGGHAPVIVAADCDLPSAVAACLAAKFRNAGQVCTSPTRFLVAKEIYTEFTNAFAEQASSLRVGNGLDETTQMGPLIAGRRIDWMEQLVEDAEANGARLITGGHRIDDVGSFFEPTVLCDITPDALAMTEEPFGPLALMVPVDTLDAALEEANRLPVGLAAYAFTTSQATALRIQSDLNAGVVGINQTAVSLPEAPFGGVNETGWGSEGGIEGLETFLRTKFVNELVL
ncbi:MAG: NAD-dependent succinate-semialdehyde dehydrogenase [Hyphomicrobiaceae bacterium]